MGEIQRQIDAADVRTQEKFGGAGAAPPSFMRKFTEN
jgi:hypothetical protein